MGARELEKGSDWQSESGRSAETSLIDRNHFEVRMRPRGFRSRPLSIGAIYHIECG